jgi:enamine deaminase RidA (YjgF/YER057c/UK114 family)
MGIVSSKLASLGLTLPGPIKVPPGVVLPFRFVNIRGAHAFISGHGPVHPDGTLARPFGKLGRELTVEQGYKAARLTALAILGNLERELGDLDRVRAWTRVFGMVNSAPGFNQQPSVINGFSDLILELFGPDRGAHARSAVGMAELPFDLPVEIEAVVEIDP